MDVITVANQGEVDYSQMGVEKATNPSVKQFAQLMVKDHGTMLDGVKSLGDQVNVTPAANDKVNDLQKENQKDIADLNGKKVGKDFDKEFMEEQVDMHQETLDLLNDSMARRRTRTSRPRSPRRSRRCRRTWIRRRRSRTRSTEQMVWEPHAVIRAPELMESLGPVSQETGPSIGLP